MRGLYGLPDLIRPPDSQAHTGLDRCLTRNLKTYRIKDLPVKREKAAPLRIIHSIIAAPDFSSDPITRQLSDLVTLGFYFCLR